VNRQQTLNERFVAPIAAHLAEWDVAHVELAIYGTGDARRIARVIEDFCQRELGSGPEQTLFYRSSIGAVIGLQLLDGRQVVIKAHQPDWERARLEEITRLQAIVVKETGLAPEVVGGPAALGNGFATIEAHVSRGIVRDGHEPPIRRALATSLYSVVHCLSAMAPSSALPSSILTALPAGALWPRPHSKLFDFEATRDGAGYIDALAAEARNRMAPAGRRVIGHSDWRAEHVRFEGDTPVMAFDWDGLSLDCEAALVGVNAHMFCADWSRDDVVQAPTFDEVRAFVAEYEDAAGRKFTSAERRLCGAAFAYSVAYTSRCGHASGVDTRGEPGTFQNLIATAGERLLDL
jgi:hypothetical protein